MWEMEVELEAQWIFEQKCSEFAEIEMPTADICVATTIRTRLSPSYDIGASVKGLDAYHRFSLDRSKCTQRLQAQTSVSEAFERLVRKQKSRDSSAASFMVALLRRLIQIRREVCALDILIDDYCTQHDFNVRLLVNDWSMMWTAANEETTRIKNEVRLLLSSLG